MNFKSLYQTIINLDTPLREDNAAALKGVYNPAAFQQGENRRAADLSQSTDPQYTSAQDPIGTAIRHSQGSMEGKQGALDSIKQIAMFDDPVKVIQMAVISGATEQEILQALPQDFDLKSAMASYNPAENQKRIADLFQGRDNAVKESSNNDMDECGDDTMNTPQQSSSVTMSVSMNGSGKEGIRDLMDVLKNIEDAVQSHDDSEDELLYTAPHSTRSSEPLMGGGMDEEFANTMDTHTMNIDSMFRTGNDMHGKGVEYPKVNGGGNPMQEALVTRLYSMYSTIKESPSRSR